MQGMARNIITLICVGVVSALVLAGLNLVTEPVIEENRKEMHRETLSNFFPDMEDSDSEEIDGIKYDLVYGADGEKLGVMMEIVATGYGGDIVYYLAVCHEGEIKGVSVMDHEETPGIGDIVEDEDFKANFTGKSYKHNISEEVDAVSGATVSSNAIIASIDDAIQHFATHIKQVEDVAVDISGVPDGVYSGTGFGYTGDPIEVEVEVENEEIVSVEIVTFGDGDMAKNVTREEMPRRIVEQQDIEVDAVTNATESSKGIMQAVEDALETALVSQ